MILLGKRLIVKEHPVEKKSSGGILLTTDKPNYRTPVLSDIVEVDESLREINPAFLETDKYKVLYMPAAGIDYEVGEDHFKILNYEDVIALIKVEDI